MNRLLLLFFLLSFPTFILAQLPKVILTPTQRVANYDEYEGSIYSKTKYTESSIIDEATGTYDAKLKYNIVSDALEYEDGPNLYNIIKMPTVHARIDGDYFYYCVFKGTRGQDRSGYYVLIELNDQYRIYKKYTLKIKDPINNNVTHTHQPGELRMQTTYYLEEGGIVMELPMNKKEMLSSFSDMEGKLKAYIKKEKIRFRKEEDLIRLVARYNSLKISDSTQGRSLLSNVIRKR